MKKFFYSQNGERHGPISTAQLRELANSGRLLHEAIVEDEGSGRKSEARKIKGLFKDTNQQAFARPANDSQPPNESKNIQPQFKSPVSALLNQLTASLLELMNEKVQKGEMEKAAFESRATEILVCLDASIRQTETQQSLLTQSSDSSKQQKKTGGSPTSQTASGGRRTPPSPPAKNNKKSGGAQSSQGRDRQSAGAYHQSNAAIPLSQQPGAPSPQSGVGNTLKFGAAALAGGAFGYLLANQGRMPGRHGFGSNYGYGGYGETHVHYHGDASEQNLETSGADYGDYSEVAHHDDSSGNDATVIGADTNDDGLADTFYADTDNDGVADAIGKDTDFDGQLDEVSVDTDGDGTMDQTFVSTDDEEDGYEEDGLEEDGLEEDGYEDDGYEDIAAADVDTDMGDDMDVDMDMDMDMDFG